MIDEPDTDLLVSCSDKFTTISHHIATIHHFVPPHTTLIHTIPAKLPKDNYELYLLSKSTRVYLGCKLFIGKTLNSRSE